MVPLHTQLVFHGISEQELPALLTALDAQEKAFRKGETIYNQGSFRRMSGLLLEGSAELHFCDEDFNLVNLIHLSEGDLFGAAMLLAGNRSSPMELLALTDCRVLFLDFSILTDESRTQAGRSAAEQQLTCNLLQVFARRMQFLSQRVRILSQRKMRDKIKVYLQGLPRGEDGTILLPMNRSQMADFLYVDRSALSRELSRMKDKGVLDVHGRTLRILDEDFLFE